MLTKNRNPASASADAKSKSARRADVAGYPKRASPTVVFHEPKADWFPLAWAVFRYNSYGYIRSVDKWAENLGLKVKRFARSSWARDDGSTPEYSFGFDKHWEAWVEAEGLRTWFSANLANVYTHRGDGHGIDDPAVVGDPDEYLSSKNWKKFPPQQSAAAKFHRSLVKAVLSSLRRDFGKALNGGSAHIMARKNTVLAPFERVAWDQWHYFKLDEREPIPPAWEQQQYEWVEPVSPPLRWFDPRNCGWEPTFWHRPNTATGPNGEKLYSIHVAPGVDRAESGEPSPEEKCIQWLMELMTAFPERPPKVRSDLIEQGKSMFPGLTERGFAHSLFSARRQTGRLKWMTSGRRPKSPQ
jgi:hypothetical protein